MTEGVKPGAERHTVRAWFVGEVRLERYRHAPGPTAPIPPHIHEEYQFGLSLDCDGEYRYRGERHAVPAGALRIIQAGEVHASRDHGQDRSAVTHLLYVPPAKLREVAAERAERPEAGPDFPTPAVTDRDLSRLYLTLCASLAGQPAARLEQDALLLAALTRFVERHAAAGHRPRPPGAEPRAVATVKAYLDAHAAENLSLAHLAEVAGLSPPYLNRAFARAVGLPPHRYQTQLRVERAKALLAAGLPPRAVASETGFADQSHLGRHFKRLVGVSPGRYLAETVDRRTEGQRA